MVRWRLKDDDENTIVGAARFRSNNGLALKQAALAGLGIIMQAEMMLAEEVRQGRLISILPEHVPDPKPMNLVYSRDHHHTPKMSTFIDFMVSSFGI